MIDEVYIRLKDTNDFFILDYSRLLILAALVALSGCTFIDQNNSAQKPPDPTRFAQIVIADGLDEPMQLDFDTEGYVYWIERKGGVKRVHDESFQIDELGIMPLYEGTAPGLIGLLLDRDFEQSRHLYIYYSAAADDGDMRLSRFTLDSDNTIDTGSEIVMLEIPWEQPDGYHFGGGMTWDREGNLYLSTGDATQASQYEAIHYLNDEDSAEVFDAARTAGNTNDLRGSILRITPQPNGSYTIPEGNLFTEGEPNTRPEIYIMGNRNPWRLSIDSHTGYLHWGEVGPDAGADSDQYGAMGYDEFNVARKAGNFGWPFSYGGRPYAQYDYETKTFGELHNLQAPLNRSPNNTGLRELPPVEQSLIAYPYGVSEEWPILGSAARSAVGGPVFRRADFATDAPRVFPDYFEGKWLVTDYVRNWIMVITMSQDRTEVLNIERLLPDAQMTHNEPLDMAFSPAGDLYLVEYGIGDQGRISRIEYNAGNRAPVARAGSDRKSGAIPLELQLSSEGTVDYDGDDLDYLWTIRSDAGETIQQFTEPEPLFKLVEAGRYRLELKVTDPDGASGRDTFEVVAGNENPEVQLEIIRGNRSFYFPDAVIDYRVHVSDLEDGSLKNGDIAPGQVSLTAEYIPSGFSQGQLAALQDEGLLLPGSALQHLEARTLITKYNCESCHRMDSGLVGPSYIDIADRYDEVDEAAANLSQSIIEGSVGRWGEAPMPPNPTLPVAEARQITNYILSLNHEEQGPETLPLQGRFTTKVYDPKQVGDRLERYFDISYERGSYIFHASYTDEGSEEAENLNLTGEDVVLLRYPLIAPENADFFSDKGIVFTPSTTDPGFFVSGSQAYIGFQQIDLTGISQITIGALTRFWHWSHYLGGEIEIRLDSPDGPLVGEPQERFQSDTLTAEDGPFFGDAMGLPVEVNLSGVEGIHDVYLIFRNREAEDDDALFILTGIEFSQ